MSVEERFGTQVELEIRTAENLIQEHQELFLDSSNESVTKRRYEMEFLASIGFLRDFIEENRRGGHRGRLVILFKDNDRISRMRKVCQTAKLSETNCNDPRWVGPVNLLSRVNALEDLLVNAETVAENWVDEMVKFEGNSKPNLKELKEAKEAAANKKKVAKEAAEGEDPKNPDGDEVDDDDDEDDEDMFRGRIIKDECDSADEKEFFRKKKEMLIKKTKTTVTTSKKFMMPPPKTEKPADSKPKFVFPTLKETKLLDLADVEEGIYTKDDIQEYLDNAAPVSIPGKTSYVRWSLINQQQSSINVSNQVCASFVPLNPRPGLKAKPNPNSKNLDLINKFEKKTSEEDVTATDGRTSGIDGRVSGASGATCPSGGRPSGMVGTRASTTDSAALPNGESNTSVISESGNAAPMTNTEKREAVIKRLTEIQKAAQIVQQDNAANAAAAAYAGDAGNNDDNTANAPAPAQPTAEAAIDEPRFKPNDAIVIHGLKSEKAAGFNGREGVILGYMPQTRKYDALIDGKTRIMVKSENLKKKEGQPTLQECATFIYNQWVYPFPKSGFTRRSYHPTGWNTEYRGTFAEIQSESLTVCGKDEENKDGKDGKDGKDDAKKDGEDDSKKDESKKDGCGKDASSSSSYPTILCRASAYQNQAANAGKKMARMVKGLFYIENPDGVVGITNAPLGRHPQGYFIEVEVMGVSPTAEYDNGCLGLGVSFLQPGVQIEKIPRRLEKIEQGWFFSGPYYGQTRRLYKDGVKDIRYILDGEDTTPIKWKLGDRMSILVRPKDASKEEWTWTISMYANREIVMACHMDCRPWLREGQPVPHDLEMYGLCEAFGYVQKVRLCTEATPAGLEIPFKPKALKEAEKLARQELKSASGGVSPAKESKDVQQSIPSKKEQSSPAVQHGSDKAVAGA